MSRLDVEGIRRPLTELTSTRLERLEVFSTITSTNTYLMSQPPPALKRFRVAVADHQTSGRGSHYRRWISAPGSGIYLSFAYTFPELPGALHGLTLAIGTSVIAALERLGVEDISLKWPNDVVALDGKLGGILTEVQSGSGAGTTVVTGIGLNLYLKRDIDFAVESDWAQRAVDLKSIKPDLPQREAIVGGLIESLFMTFHEFAEFGLAPFLKVWRQHDWLRGREITATMPDRQVSGTAAGVDDDGMLLVDTADGQARILSGSIGLAGLPGRPG